MSDLQPWRNPQTSPHEVKSAQATGQTLRAWWPALLWACIIFTLSTDSFSAAHTGSILHPVLHWFYPHITDEQFDFIHHITRKSAHFTEYFIFCILVFRGVRGARAGWRWTWGFAAWFIAAVYSCLDEVHQAFVASRTASPYDSLLDSIGAFFAFLALALWFYFRRPKTPTLSEIEPEVRAPAV